jgi:hypothetical protein
MNELFEPRPVLLIQTGNVASVDVGQVGFNHGKTAPLLLQSTTSSTINNKVSEIHTYFGYPRAHEDDAERAVRAGLAKLRIQQPLRVRIGVATGLVVVGDLVGSGEFQERGVVGETPNLAARLQGIAAPNTVVIAEGTRRLLGNLFEMGLET